MNDERSYGVIVQQGQAVHLYGPMDKQTADAFSEFMANEVDPAVVLPMHSPTRELLAWYGSERARVFHSQRDGRTHNVMPPGNYVVGSDGVAYGPFQQPGEGKSHG